jgi:hypothetical protein
VGSQPTATIEESACTPLEITASGTLEDLTGSARLAEAYFGAH